MKIASTRRPRFARLTSEVPLPSSYSIDLIRRVCGLAGSPSLLDDCRANAAESQLVKAVLANEPTAVFDALLTSFSYQGVSDAVAGNYLRQHGGATWASIKRGLKFAPSCPHLAGFSQLRGCRYDKGSFTCAEPELIDSCPLPRYRLRNGRLNQTAYSFFMFVRDVADCNLIRWIDQQLSRSGQRSTVPSQQWLSDQLVGPLRAVYGVSDKILSMALSDLLIGASAGRPLWFEAGISMIAIDTLVHNFLHRTGILSQCGLTHAYGALCYAPNGCSDIIRQVATKIDARSFNPQFPKTFPRFVQHAIWRYCAADGMNVCNGNRINDRQPCQNLYCQLYRSCSKKQLKM